MIINCNQLVKKYSGIITPDNLIACLTYIKQKDFAWNTFKATPEHRNLLYIITYNATISAYVNRIFKKVLNDM